MGSKTEVQCESPSKMVARNSGLSLHSGSWGKANRFDDSGKFSSTPAGEQYYARCKLFGKPGGRMASFGVSSRPDYSRNHVLDPGCYGIPNKPHNTQFTNIKLKGRLNVKSNTNDCGPGPASYSLPTTLTDCRTCRMHLPLPDRQEQAYEVTSFESVPQMRSTVSTFGTSKREGVVGKTCTPDSDLYYYHNNLLTGEDYLKRSRSCTFGQGRRAQIGGSDYDAPLGNQVVLSASKSCSALDGFRQASTSLPLVGSRKVRRRKISSNSTTSGDASPAGDLFATQ